MLTGRRIAALLPAVVEAANAGAFIPQNLHAVMTQRMVQEAVRVAAEVATVHLDDLLAAVRRTPLPLRRLQLAVVAAIEPAVSHLTTACSPPRLHISPEEATAARARLLAGLADKLELLRVDNSALFASALHALRSAIVTRYYVDVEPALAPILANLAAKRPPTAADKGAAKAAAVSVCERVLAAIVAEAGQAAPYRDLGLGFGGERDAGLVPDPLDSASSSLAPAARLLLWELWPAKASDEAYGTRADWDRELAEDPSRLMEQGRLESELNCAHFSGVAAHTHAQMELASQQVNLLNDRVAAGEKLSQELQAKLADQQAAALKLKEEMEKAQQEAAAAKAAAEAAQRAARSAGSAGGRGKKRSRCEIM